MDYEGKQTIPRLASRWRKVARGVNPALKPWICSTGRSAVVSEGVAGRAQLAEGVGGTQVRCSPLQIPCLKYE